MIETVTLDDMLATGATYRRLDYWIRCGYLPTPEHSRKWEGGSGNPRAFTVEHRDLLWYMVRLIDAGLTVEVAAQAARQRVQGGVSVIAAGEVTFTWDCPPPPDLDHDREEPR